jgi:hypothetical protein
MSSLLTVLWKLIDRYVESTTTTKMSKIKIFKQLLSFLSGPISTIFNQNPFDSFEHETICEQISVPSIFHVHLQNFSENA